MTATPCTVTNTCYRCSQVKDLCLFLRDKRVRPKGYRNICLSCHSQDDKKYRSKNIDRVRELARKRVRKYYSRLSQERKSANNEKSNLKQYNLTVDSYSALSKQQNNVCAICGKTPFWNRNIKRPNRLHVDHDHETGKVRGLLCYNCNLLLGHCKNDVAILEKAIVYLQRSTW